jgi:hypothetical protein
LRGKVIEAQKNRHEEKERLTESGKVMLIIRGKDFPTFRKVFSSASPTHEVYEELSRRALELENPPVNTHTNAAPWFYNNEDRLYLASHDKIGDRGLVWGDSINVYIKKR